MSGVAIVTDSSCDLPVALAAEHGIEIVPLTIRFGNEEFVDRRDLTPSEFWARSSASPVLPETASPPPGAFEQVFRALGARGADGVVCLTISSRLSGTGQAAEIAAKAVAADVPVRVVDSMSLTTGLGMMAVAAARRAREGAVIDEVVATAAGLVPRTRVFAALDTLENLKKGGRLTGAQAWLGSMLSIKPTIMVREGTVVPDVRQRTRARALRHLVDRVRQHGPVESLSVVHGDAPDVDELLDELDDLYPRAGIVVADVGAVIGSHSGPRVIGVTFQVPG